MSKASTAVPSTELKVEAVEIPEEAFTPLIPERFALMPRKPPDLEFVDDNVRPHNFST